MHEQDLTLDNIDCRRYEHEEKDWNPGLSEFEGLFDNYTKKLTLQIYEKQQYLYKTVSMMVNFWISILYFDAENTIGIYRKKS